MPERKKPEVSKEPYREYGGSWRDAIWGNEESKGNATNYQYRDAELEVIWVTNVPKSDQSAVRYFHTLLTWDKPAVYVEKKGPEDTDYTLMPYRFDPETLETTKIKE